MIRRASRRLSNRHELHEPDLMSLTLTVLAAGMGSRYGGLKQIDPVGPSGETVLDYSVYDALQAGFDRVVFVIRHDIERAFRAAVGKRFEGCVDVSYAFQELSRVPEGFTVPGTREKPWGTAHAVWVCEELIDSPFAVINADDFYGADSYRVLAEFLRTETDDRKAHYAMVGFKLRNTLSAHGPVARGVCEVDDEQYLRSVTEHTHVVPRGEAAVSMDGNGGEHPLTGDEWVSMNMWGFTPSVFAQLRTRFASFLERHGREDRSEFFIPFFVDELIEDGLADVRVRPGTARWFGVTYRDDKPTVEQAIRQRIEQGDYPEALWARVVD